jgi:RNA polymerase sigma-70 factor (ECF subfamily)
MKAKIKFAISLSIAAMLPAILTQPVIAVDLLERYPTQLTAGDAEPDHARPWKFTPDDLYRVSHFVVKVGDTLKVETGAADLGVGHCDNGAVWAVLIPHESGTLTSPVAKQDEAVAHVWLRFHPGQVDRLFPTDTVLAGGNTNLMIQMQAIVNTKFRSSWHAGMNAMIPEPKDMTVYVDTKDGSHRFFMVDTQAKTAEYVAAFDSRSSQNPGTGPLSLETAPPVVVKTVPEAGARDVSSGIVEIKVTFSKEMTDKSWSWCQAWEGSTGESVGDPRYESDHKTCVWKVKLEPGKTYACWLNTDGFQNFKDQQGHPAVPYLLTFCTGAAEKEKSEKPSASVPQTEPAGPNRPNVVSVSPADGATNVDPRQELRIRFDQSMNPNVMGINWSSGGFVPDGQPRYEPARNEFVIPVRLVPGRTNELMAQSSSTGSGGFRTTSLTYAGDYRWHFTTKPVVVKPGAVKPNVIRISPASGETLPVLTLLEITFDQPMMPPDQGFPYLRKTGSSFDLPAQIPAFDYDPSSHRFTVPVVLPPDNDTKLMLDGFYSADGVASDPIVIRCQIGTNSYSSGQRNLIATAAKDPRLEQLVSSMKAARARLNSGTETVQWTRFFGGKESFKWIMANSATFKWQGTNQIYADISEIMNLKAFILGNDGKTCWLYADDPNGRRLDSSPAALVPDIYTSVADPFTLTKFTVAEAIAKGQLVYQGQTQFEGRACHRVQSWMVRQPQNENDRVFAAKLEWWIDAETLLPVQVIENSQYGSETFRFHYEQLNQPLPDAAFQPPAMTGINARKDGFKLFKQETPLPDEKRFLTIKDGSNGEMSGRLGWSSPGGTTSSGLN